MSFTEIFYDIAILIELHGVSTSFDHEKMMSLAWYVLFVRAYFNFIKITII